MMNATQNNRNHLLIEPDPISYSFDTPGWHVIGVFLLLIIIIWAIELIIRYRKNRYRREAIKHLDQIAHSSASLQEKATAINRLLKQVAMHIHNRKAVAALTSRSWLTFLVDTSKTSCFEEELFNTIQKGQYDAHQLTEIKINTYILQAGKWIKTHQLKRTTKKKSA